MPAYLFPIAIRYAETIDYVDSGRQLIETATRSTTGEIPTGDPGMSGLPERSRLSSSASGWPNRSLEVAQIACRHIPLLVDEVLWQRCCRLHTVDGVKGTK